MKVALLCIGALLVLACSAHAPGKRNNGNMNGNGNGNGNGNTGNCGSGGGGGAGAPCFDCATMEIANIYTFPNVVSEANSDDPQENAGPNPNNAVGPDREVLNDNLAFTLVERGSNKILDQTDSGSFIGVANGAGWVTYDRTDKRDGRFYISEPAVNDCNLYTTVLPPNNASGVKCSGGASWGAQTFFVTAPLSVVSPLNGCTPLPPGSLNGTIAFVQRGGCLFRIKAKIVQNAGALAMLAFDNVNEGTISMAGTDPTITIPGVIVSLADGTAILANVPAIVNLNSDALDRVNSPLYFAVSKTPSPDSFSTVTDWYTYTFSSPLTQTYAIFFDHHATTVDTFTLVGQMWGPAYPNGTILWAGTYYLTLDKNAMASGAGIVVINEVINPKQSYTVPAPLSLPLAEADPKQWYIGLGDTYPTVNCAEQVDYLHVYWSTKTTPISSTPIAIKMPNSRCKLATVTSDADGGIFAPIGARQPATSAPANETVGLQVDPDFASASTNGRVLVFSFASQGPNNGVYVNWGAISLDNFWVNGTLTLTHFGEINQLSKNIDTYYPQIAIGARGEIALSGFMSGNFTYGSGWITARLPTYPQNSMGFPLTVWAPGFLTYQSLRPFTQPPLNTWLTVNGLDIDPKGESFHLYTAIGNPAGPLDQYGRASQWTTSMAGYEVDSIGFCPDDPNAPPIAPPIPNPPCDRSWNNAPPGPRRNTCVKRNSRAHNCRDQ